MNQNTNVAYDFSKFEATEPRKSTDLWVAPSRKVKPKTKSLSGICLGALLLSMVVMIIYNQVILTELSSQIGESKQILTTLESESIRLSAELSSNSSIRTLEEYAKAQFGLGKLESNQIVYIDMHENDCIEITEKGQKQTGGEKISDTAGEIMEYLKLK